VIFYLAAAIVTVAASENPRDRGSPLSRSGGQAITSNRRLRQPTHVSGNTECYVREDLAAARNVLAVVDASGWFDGFSTVTSLVLTVIGVIIAVLAALLSYRAIRVVHGDAVSDRLFGSLGDLLAALVRIEFAVQELSWMSGWLAAPIW
jgi:hypothetical protein